MTNIGTYFEIPVVDMERAIDFYSYVFDCKFSKDIIHDCEMAFFPYQKEESGVSGALVKGDSYKPSTEGSLVYLYTQDIDATMKKGIEKGGLELFPKSPVPRFTKCLIGYFELLKKFACWGDVL